jgi:hypothetical protein
MNELDEKIWGSLFKSALCSDNTWYCYTSNLSFDDNMKFCNESNQDVDFYITKNNKMVMTLKEANRMLKLNQL